MPSVVAMPLVVSERHRRSAGMVTMSRNLRTSEILWRPPSAKKDPVLWLFRLTIVNTPKWRRRSVKSHVRSDAAKRSIRKRHVCSCLNTSIASLDHVDCFFLGLVCHFLAVVRGIARVMGHPGQTHARNHYGLWRRGADFRRGIRTGREAVRIGKYSGAPGVTIPFATDRDHEAVTYVS